MNFFVIGLSSDQEIVIWGSKEFARKVKIKPKDDDLKGLGEKRCNKTRGKAKTVFDFQIDPEA